METKEFLHVSLFPTRIIVLTKQFLQELTEKHDVADKLFKELKHHTEQFATHFRHATADSAET